MKQVGLLAALVCGLAAGAVASEHGGSVAEQLPATHAPPVVANAKAAPSAGDLGDLPIVEVRAEMVGREPLFVIVSGDGGWASIDRRLAETIVERGYSVVGLDSLRYFWTRRTPEEASADLARILRHYASAWGCNQAVVIGYSRGADVVPFMVNRLPKELLSELRVVAVLGPGRQVDFEFHLTDWFSDAPRATSQPTQPEVVKLAGIRVICVYGEAEKDSLCPRLSGRNVRVAKLPGAHHFDGRYDEIANIILEEVTAAGHD